MIDRDALWLWLFSADGVGLATANDLWARLGERGVQLDDFFELGESEWATDFGVNARAVKGLAMQKSRIAEIANQAESLREKGIYLISLESAHYPTVLKASLGRRTPPLLFATGNLSVLGKDAVAVAGARDASKIGLTIAHSIGQAAARHGFVVVSGGARGTDRAAHIGALAAGGATVVVLSCGILRYRPATALSERTDAQSTLLISELPPTMTWDTGGAMARNRIVCALASAVIIVEAKATGGTINAARKALELGKPLFVVRLEGAEIDVQGNKHLLREGGRPLRVRYDSDSETADVDLSPIIEAISSGAPPIQPSEQQDLFSP